jgi:hypothetical protein
LQDAGATKNQVEEIISELPFYCFKAGIDVEILVDLLKRFKAYLEANSSDSDQTNLIVELYHSAIEYSKTKINEINSKIIETYNDGKLEAVLKVILHDDKVRELNAGQLVPISKQKTVERIIDVIRNPAGYKDLFFGGGQDS